jgi:hypothetical protein
MCCGEASRKRLKSTKTIKPKDGGGGGGEEGGGRLRVAKVTVGS